MEFVDLRSDTVTQPDTAMRRVIAEAPVGDDVFGDDPTVNRLQERMADLLGKEAALYVPSGTMANQVALRAQSQRGDQVICEDGAHVYRYEAGAPAALSGLLMTTIEGRGGVLTWQDIEPHLIPDDSHCALPGVICLENTHNRSGGRVQPQDAVIEIGREAHARGLALHLDGARLWNAHVAGGLSLADLAAPADTVSVCFSKALGAPVGSILAGPRTVIAGAHRARKLFGGGMRQAGILAAGCLYALEHNLPRLADDHRRAGRLAEGLDNSAITLDHAVETNIVIYRTADEQHLLDHLSGRGVHGVAFGAGRVRLVPNLMVGDDQIEHTLDALNSYPEEPA